MNKICLSLIVLFCISITAGISQCIMDTTDTDVIVLVDNSESISNAEFTNMEAIVLSTLNQLTTNCPNARKGVVHYGGTFGTSVTIEHQLSATNTINTITRQFCTTPACSDGGDDLNNALGEIIQMMDNGMLLRDTNNNLEIIIFSDAFSDAFCGSFNCSITLPTTNADSLKRGLGASITVVGLSSLARAEFLGITASVGGNYTGSLNNACNSSFEGCTLPRQYIAAEFTDNPLILAGQIAQLLPCARQIDSPASVDAGADVTICGDRGDSTTLIATAIMGQSPFDFIWQGATGSGSSFTVSPTLSTTYSVTMVDDNGCMATDDVFVEVITCGPDCTNDTIASDIIFLIDNSASIDNSEFAELEDIIIQSIAGVRTACPLSRRAVVHYGGAFGQEIMIQNGLENSDVISTVSRQFCQSMPCNNGGHDLNFAMGELLQSIQDGSLNHDTANNLSIVVFTDAINENGCSNNNCSVSLPTTNVDLLKSTYGADVTVVGISDQAASEALALTASVGGSFNGSLDASCSSTLNGCDLPRKYLEIEFTTDPVVVANQLVADLTCGAEIIEPVMIDLGPDQTICSNLNETAFINISVLNGDEPITYQWDNNQGTFQSIIVRPIVPTTYSVTATDANGCMTVESVTITPITCNTCFADAGLPQEPKELCLGNGRATITIDINESLNVPAAFEEVYLLTDENLTIINFNVGRRAFTVTEPGIYRVHTLIAEVNRRSSVDFLDLSIIRRGVSNLFIVGNCIIDHGICADLDYPGRVHIVLPPEDMMCMEFENSINLCSDGIDNDGDGLVDCVDDDCKPLINCLENTLLACNDLFDNDLDGLIDCNDPDCYEFTRCFERGEQCKDGIDNDGDGLIDCADDSCFSSGECMEDSPFTCKDGLDNDNDGLTDCEEASCQRFIICSEWGEQACSDGMDNDRDGLVDCADADCRISFSDVCTAIESTMAFCTDGLDNDSDGLVDCEDPDCGIASVDEDFIRQDLEILTTTCPSNDNGSITFRLGSGIWQYSIDGGVSFFNDSIFASLDTGNYNLAIRSVAGCVADGGTVRVDGEVCPEICDNGIDDDGDGLTDCDDSECGVIEALPAQVIQPVCPTVDNGMIRLFYISAGSVMGIEYSIDNGQTFSNAPVFRNLDPGMYRIVARTEFGCTAEATVVLDSQSCPEICNNGLDDDGDGDIDCADNECGFSISSNDIFITEPSNCPTPDNGSITINLANPTAFDYKLEDNEFGSVSNFDNLSPGDYLITVRNESGCTDTLTITLAQFPCVEICNNGLDDDGDGMVDCQDGDCNEGITGVELVTSITTCPDNNDGLIQVIGATSGLEFSIDGVNFQTTATFEGLVPEDYNITIRNTNGCESDRAVTVVGSDCTEVCDNGIDDDGDGLVDCQDDSCNGGLDVLITPTEPSCPDKTDGTIAIASSVSGLEYSLDGESFQTETLFSNLEAGMYQLTIRNSNGCSIIEEVELIDLLCTEVCDNGTDDDGDGLVDCEDDDCFQPIVITENVSSPICPFTDNGIIEIDSLGSGFTYAIDDGEFQEDTIFTNLSAGTYTILVRNLNNCITSKEVQVTGPVECIEICDNDLDDDGDGLIDCSDPDCGIEINLSTLQVLGATCPDANNGSIEFSIDNTDDFTFSLNGEAPQSSPIFSNLEPGENLVFIQNPIGCVDTLVASIPEISCTEICDNGIDDDDDGLIDCDDDNCQFGLDVEVLVTDPVCPDSLNGSILIRAGAFGSEYSIDSAEFSIITGRENILPGLRELFTVNTAGCSVIDTFIISSVDCTEICDNEIDDDGDGLIDCADPDCIESLTCIEPIDSCVFVPMQVLISETSCPDDTDGAIAISGGLDDYMYSLNGSPFQLLNIFGALGVGSLEITIRNEFGCDTILFAEMTSVSDCAFLPILGDEGLVIESGGIQVNLKVVLEGAYNLSAGEMDTWLNDYGYLPGQDPQTFFGLRTDPGQPYTGAPWFYGGREHHSLIDDDNLITSNYTESVVDWVLISLRTGISKNTEIYRTAALLHRNGSIQLIEAIPEIFNFPDFYIVVEHRNHLPIMTPVPVPIVNGVLTYDFTKSDSYTSIVGTGQKLLGGVYMMLAANGEMTTMLSSDVDINIHDLTAWLFLNGSNSGYYDEDYDMNGDVNIKDRILWEKNNGLFSSVPTK